MPTQTIGPNTIQYEERTTSRSGRYGGSGATQTGKWWFRSTVTATGVPVELTEDVLIQAVLGATEITSPTVAGHILDSFDYEPIEDEQCSYFNVDAQYIEPQLLSVSRPDPGTARFRWRSQGENTKIVAPIAVEHSPDPDNKAPAVNRFITAGVGPVQYKLIGDSGDKKKGPAGVTVIKPKFSFAYDFTLAKSSVTTAYIGVCAGIVGKVNDAPWGPGGATGLQFPKGDVLCTGIDGSYTLGEESTLTFEFTVSESTPLPGITIGTVSGIVKEGWEYMEVHPERKIDVVAGKAVREVQQVDIWKVYEHADFQTLGIPGTG